MSKCIDETGNKYGKLTVIKRAENDAYGGARWQCLCECGNITTVRAQDLRRGKTKSCGCQIGKNNLIDITGLKVGKLTVLSFSHIGENDKHSYWLCQCDCGNTTLVSKPNLMSGQASSCGCKHKSVGEERISEILNELNIEYKRQYSFKDLIGDTGKLLYFDFYIPKYNILIEYDGIQHFQEIKYFNSFEKTQKYDKRKNEYCNLKNIALIRIPYTDLPKLNSHYLITAIENLKKNKN